MNLKIINTACRIEKWPAFPSNQRAAWLNPLSVFMADKLSIAPETSATVFNIASGTGHASARMQELYPNFKICDFDIADIPLAQRFPNFIQSDYHHLPVEPQMADLLFCFFGLDYSLQPETVVQEWQRVIKDGGKALITLHSPFSSIVTKLSAPSLKNTSAILTAYEKNDLDLFYSMIDFYFRNINILEKLKNPAAAYEFLKTYYEISNYLLQRKDYLFNSPAQISTYFENLGFRASGIFLIQHDGSLIDPANVTDYAQLPHDGWLITLEK